tara:strand:- start:278 stop:799 length:522 start_codon:yes stop_codon:yes gene_type:complete
MKSIIITYFLWLMFGFFGIHKFYLGKTWQGILYIFTIGGFLILWLIDLFTIPAQVAAINGTIKKSTKSTKSKRAKSKSKDIKTVRVKNGRVQEHVNGSMKRTYGANVITADTDGDIVAVVTKSGRVEEYINGSMKRSFGSNAVDVQVSNGTIAVSMQNGRTQEYKDGAMRRSY